MAQKFDVISELYDRACLEIITDPVKWQSFLQTAGRNFKLRFDEQFLLFIQRPDATAVLEIERWNETFERWVNKGAKGIAVFESADRSRQRLIHYFDISDTHESSHSQPVPIWNMKPEYETTVIEALKNAFGSVYDITSLESVIKESVSNIIKNNTEKYVSDFMNVGLGSDIKSLPTEEANSLYLNFVKDSVSYMIMARLGLDVDKIYSPSDFAVLSKFNSQEVFNAVGVATNKTAKIALEQIAKSILMYEQKNRTFDLSENKNYNADVNKNEGRNNYGNNIHAGGRLSSSGLEATGTTGSNAGKMGSDEEKLPEGRARNHILQSTDERDSDSALGRSGKESDRLGGELSQADGSESRSDRTDESGRYDEVGRSDEQHQTLGAGNREGTSDLRLDAKPLPSVNEQLKLFEQAEVSNTTTSAFSIPQEVIDATVRQGSGFVDGKMRIYEQFQKSFSTKENADFLKKEYGIGGSSHAGGFEGYSKNFDAKGLEIYKGYAEDRPRVMLKWSQVATLIEQQISQGRYLNDKESARYPQWLEKEEARRAEIEEEKRNREILSTAPHAETEQPDNDDIIGKEVVIDDRRFVIEKVEKISGDVSMRDITFEDTVGIPINRIENIDFVRSLLAEQSIDKTQPFENEYRLLSRLKSDCEYFLGTGARAEKHLWAGSVDEQIDKMRELYDLLPEKPEWLSKQDIDNYERQMIGSAQSKNNYEYHLGDTVYIGASEYEVLSFDDNRVMLYDPKFPLFNKGFTKDEFDRKVRENPLNDHLIVENEPMLHFDSNEFEKLIPHGMRYKQAEVVNDNEMYWVTQNIFTSVELQQFQKAIREYDGNIEKFYVTSRDISSSYNFEDDRANKVLAVVTPDSIQQDDYVKAIQEAGFGEYLNEAVEEKETATDYEDVFFVDKENKTVTWMYYNPDSNAGGQYVINTITFDGVIGNVPFGDFKVSDKQYDKYNFLIHDYFFAKSLDKLRPGGVLALVTSKGTMDKDNPSVRKYIAQRAELLGAIRLPNDTFKGNAGTEVVSDILILQKRDRLIDIEPDWVYLDTDENGIKMNSYFVQHPEMILGEMKMVSGRFGPEATCEAFENADLGELLNEAVINIHGEISEYEVADEIDEEDNSIPADPTVRNFSYTVLDDKIYFRENSRMSPAIVSATAENRIKGMVAIRDSVRNLIELQTEDYPDSEIKQAQEKLNTLYDSFTKKYGLINSRANTSAFSDDSSYALLSALEVINENGELERKADMFYKRTIKPHKAVTEVDTADEALAVSMGEKATIDMEYMRELTGKSEEELFADLKGVIFLNPLYGYGNVSEQKYLMADEYLSGNVREKLITAKKSAEVYPDDYKINVEALEKVQPKDLTASEIAVRLGATWLPPEIIQQFMFEFLGTPYYARWNIKVHFSQYSGEWNIEGKSYDRSNVKAYSTYGTSRINGYKIIEETLNLKDVRIFDYVEDEDGKRKAVLNKKETAIAQAKQELIKQGFQDWIWADPARREKLTKMYNEKFNSIRPREYDGSHIVFNGMNPEIKLREHQKNAVAHILYGGNTLLAHAVGAGKTFEMVAAAMESKRLGLCNKSLFVVPNHLTEQWAAEFLQLYPAANILVATKKDFETKNRKKFCGRIATGDYDAVIIGHSQFEKIPMSIERQRAILEQQLEELTDGIADLKRNRGENFSIKQLEKSRKAVKQKLEKLNDQSRKDDVVTFEELGVDRLFIDESHYYKNLYLYTKMRNVGGIAQTEAQKSSDLFMKCRYLDELTGGRGTVFATGTPISNSMVELYTIQRYLQYNTLVKNNLQHFDAWASTFGETVTAVELTPEGTGYRAKTRFAKFYNLPELMAMFKEVADIKTADMLDLPVPQAHYHNIAVKPSEMQKEMVASLAERAEKVRGGAVDSSVDNMLKITNDGRKLALDQRMLNDMLPDFEDSKINACVDNIYRIWTETADKKSAQLVFCDLSTPKNDGTFSVYDDIRKKLIERGISDSEVKFIHEADTDIKKKELFQKTRKGEVRVLLGSTQKMGAGTNVQDRLIALHDVDCPWRPSDLEQRSGRIIRQGNSNPDVDIFRYVTEQTFDAYLYQLVEGKQKFASQIMTSKSPVRSAEDIDETALSYAEIKMLATGNPYIKEKMDLDIQVQKLKLLKSNFLSEKYRLEDKIIKYYPQQITSLQNKIEGLKQDVETAKRNPKPTDDHFVGMEVNGVFYSEKAEAGKAIIEACKLMSSPEPIYLGKYRGFDMELSFDTLERTYMIKIKGSTSRNVFLGEDSYGNITRIDNGVEKFSEALSFAENELANTKAQFETAKTEVEKPFAQDEELKTKLARLDELNILLNMDKTENEIVGGEPDESEVPPGKKVKEYELTR
mgnify:CR=1 FL=1